MSNRRDYKSTLRAEQALETRLRVRKSARELFATDGFSATTIAQIASDAGVAPQTIYAVFGSKGGIITAMLEDLEESADQQAWIDKVLSEEDPRRQLRLFVSWIRTLFELGAPIFRAALAARGDPDVAALAERGDGKRRGGTRALTKIWAAKGALRDGLDAEAAAQRLWLLTSVEQFLHAIDGLGWEPASYERWLGDLLERDLLTPR